MNSYYLVIAISFFVFTIGCTNYDGDTYTKHEIEALSNIIPEIIQFSSFPPNSHNNKTLYISSKLGNSVALIEAPKDESNIISVDGIPVPKERIKRLRKEYQDAYKEYKLEKELFKKLENGSIKSRYIKREIKADSISIHLIDEDELPIGKIGENEIGFIIFSRIAFTNNYRKGALHYFFYCGEACGIFCNIKIRKKNGKWSIATCYSGGIG